MKLGEAQGGDDAGDGDEQRDVVLVEGLVDLLVLTNPVVRDDVVAAAKARIADGDHPSAEAVARRLVDGLVAATPAADGDERLL